MEKLFTLLEGKKTYICAVTGSLIVLLKLLNVLDDAIANTLLGLLGFGGLAALHAKK